MGIKDRWEEIYRNLNIEYDVRSIINRSIMLKIK